MENLIDIFNINNEKILNKKIQKKYFYNSDNLKKTEKNIIKDNIDKIELILMMQPNIVKIPSYEDEDTEYIELALIKVYILKEGKELEIAEIINKLIQYPIILILEYEENITMALSEKRKDKITGQNNILEDILVLKNIKKYKNYEEYLISLMYLNKVNLKEYYKDLYKKTYALEISRNLDCYEKISNKQYQELKESYYILKNLDLNIETYRNKIKEEKDIGRRVDLNLNMRKLETKREKLFKNLQEI